MFEKLRESIAPPHLFVMRVIRAIVLGLILIAIAQFIGMCGYHYYEDMSWVDSFANAAMILSGMGPLTPLQTVGGKLFAGVYALFSGLIFILVIGIVFAPAVHRFFHKMHVDEK